MNEKMTHVSITSNSIIRLALIAIGIFTIYLIKDVVITLLVSIIFASFIEIISEKLKRKYRIPRGIVVVTVFFGILATISALLYFLIPMFFDQVTMLASQVSRAFPNIEWIKVLQSKGFTNGAQQLAEGISNNESLSEIVTNSRTFFTYLSTTLFGSISTFFNAVVHLVLILVISFYLSIQPRGVENFLRVILPIRHEEYVVGLWKRVERKIAMWVQGQLLLGLIVGLLTFVGLQILGVEYSLLLALITALFELIPFGIVFAVIPAVVIAIINNGVMTGLIVLLMYIVLQQIENYIISPMLTKKTAGVPPLVVIISALAGFELLGFWGVLISVPVAVLIMEVLSDFEQKKIFARNQQ